MDPVGCNSRNCRVDSSEALAGGVVRRRGFVLVLPPLGPVFGLTLGEFLDTVLRPVLDPLLRPVLCIIRGGHDDQHSPAAPTLARRVVSAVFPNGNRLSWPLADRGRACTSCQSRTGRGRCGPAPWPRWPSPRPARTPRHHQSAWFPCRRHPADRCRSAGPPWSDRRV